MQAIEAERTWEQVAEEYRKRHPEEDINGATARLVFSRAVGKLRRELCLSENGRVSPVHAEQPD